MLMLPVAKVQVGCVGIKVGAFGVAGCGMILKLAGAERQPPVFFAIKVCVVPAVSKL